MNNEGVNNSANSRFGPLAAIVAIGAVAGGVSAIAQNRENKKQAERQRQSIDSAINAMNKINQDKIKLMQADFDISESYNTNYQMASGFANSNFNRINRANRERFKKVIDIEKQNNKLNAQQLAAGKPISPSGLSQFANVLGGATGLAGSFASIGSVLNSSSG